MNKRLIVKLVGSVLLVEGALMAVSLLVSLIMGGDDAPALILSMIITAGVGGLLQLVRPADDTLHAREGFAVVAFSWLFVSMFGGLPFFTLPLSNFHHLCNSGIGVALTIASGQSLRHCRKNLVAVSCEHLFSSYPLSVL